MIPAVRSGHEPDRANHYVEPVRVDCRNCGEKVAVRPDVERVCCPRCGNMWSWKTKQLIRGQR